MDWRTLSARWNGNNNGSSHAQGPSDTPRRWIAHASHERSAMPHRAGPGSRPRLRPEGESSAVSGSDPTSQPDPNPRPAPRLITLDGSKGEGGGQILRTALTLS